MTLATAGLQCALALGLVVACDKNTGRAPVNEPQDSGSTRGDTGGASGGARDGGARDGGTGDGGAADGGASDSTGGGDAPATGVEAGAPDSADDAASAAGPALAHIYVGGGASPNIVAFRLDAALSMLTPLGPTSHGANIGYMAADLPRLRLFVASGPVVTSYAIDPMSGALSPLGQLNPGAGGSTYLSVHPTGRWVFTADYDSGTAAVVPVTADGKPSRASDSQMAGPQAHGITPDPTGQFVLVPCRAGNRIAQYKFDTAGGKLLPNSPALYAQPGGPRHIAIHPTQPFVYLVTQDSGSVISYKMDADGRLADPQVLKMAGEDRGAHIVVSPDGKHVYASGRTTNGIYAYAVDPATGRLEAVGSISEGIAVPRDFAIDPRGRFIAVTNQEDGTLVIFGIDAATGKLTKGPTAATVNLAQAVAIAYLP